ncbi:UNVERIFIED_CONTAM: Serine/threonine-protein kinase ATG1c [Sesamum calycinum]|uniref:Serine/threonine-protein kinase ATG1c n=1 Tax=Sesamum calycinum TaxID=2727403 RepID=A0AAW2NVI0_9LAMI
MAQSTRGYYEVGDYMVGKQIGAGSFSTVWHARHRVHGTEVAIKEIVTARLSPKLQESLKSEIFILKRVNHPNIIRLHDMIEEPGKMYIILEYCKGGDLSMYIQQTQGRVPEATAKQFMQQLAEGLKVLRENNLIHRDLKPQNLLLSTDGDNCILKIADFGFASLTSAAQKLLFLLPDLYNLEALRKLYVVHHCTWLQKSCSSRKYDAKADLWSVGAILYQLVTGRTPFTGSNQIHLLQNIIRSTCLQFPPEAKDLSPHCMDLCKKLLQRNPVERLTFEEFFNHPYLSQREPDESIRQSGRVLGGFPHAESNTEETLKEDCLPFSLHNDSSSPHGSTSFHNKTASSKYSHAPHKTEITGSSLGSRCLSEGNLRESLKNTGLGLLDNHPKVMDSLESIVQDYVIVSGPLLDLSYLAHASKPSHFLSRSGSPSLYSGNMNSKPSTSEPIIGETGRVDNTGIIEHRLSVPGISQGSMDIAETLEQPSTDCMTRISSLQRSAAAITELVNDKRASAVIVQIWSEKMFLSSYVITLCQLSIKSAVEVERSLVRKASRSLFSSAHSAQIHFKPSISDKPPEKSPSHQRRFREVSKVQYSPDSQKSNDLANAQGQLDIYSEIERAFLHEVGHAEELAELIEPIVPMMFCKFTYFREYGDARCYGINISVCPCFGQTWSCTSLSIYSRGEPKYFCGASLIAGGFGMNRMLVDEYMGDVETAVVFYSKAVRLLLFLLKEAPCLIVNPPFFLTNSDRYRIQNYIDVLNNRQSISRSLKEWLC